MCTSTGIDNISGEFLKYGGGTGQHALLQLFKRVQLLQDLPNEWYESIVKPDGSKEVPGQLLWNYLSSVVYKTLVRIMESHTINFI